MKFFNWIALVSSLLTFNLVSAAHPAWVQERHGWKALGYIIVSADQAATIQSQPEKYLEKRLLGNVFPLGGEFYVASHPSILMRHRMNRQEWPNIAGPPPEGDERFLRYGRETSLQICQVLFAPEIKLRYRYERTDVPMSKPKDLHMRPLRGRPHLDSQAPFHESRYSNAEDRQIGIYGTMGETLLDHVRAPILRCTLYERKPAARSVQVYDLANYYEPYMYGTVSHDAMEILRPQMKLICHASLSEAEILSAPTMNWLRPQIDFNTDRYFTIAKMMDAEEEQRKARAVGLDSSLGQPAPSRVRAIGRQLAPLQIPEAQSPRPARVIEPPSPYIEATPDLRLLSQLEAERKRQVAGLARFYRASVDQMESRIMQAHNNVLDRFHRRLQGIHIYDSKWHQTRDNELARLFPSRAEINRRLARLSPPLPDIVKGAFGH